MITLLSLLFSTTAGDQDGDGNVDEVTVTISGSTELNYDWVFATNGAGELLYGPASGTQEMPTLHLQTEQ